MLRLLAALILASPLVKGIAAEPVLENFNGSALQPSLWHAADGWGNGSFTSTFWLKDQLSVKDGKLILSLDDTVCRKTPSRCQGKTNAGAEVRSKQKIANGVVSASMKAAKGEGIITALFKYTGPHDGDPHDEVDIEILGKNTTKAQLNYWVNGKSRLEKLIDLGFDASKGFHRYGWKQTSRSITWTIDGREVHTVKALSSADLPKTPAKVMVSLWAAEPGTASDLQWAGDITKTSLPVSASFDWIRIEPSF